MNKDYNVFSCTRGDVREWWNIVPISISFDFLLFSNISILKDSPETCRAH
jgi:hypothetical protein